MTASENTRIRSDNSGVTPDAPTAAQHITNYLRRTDRTVTVDDLEATLEHTRHELKQALRGLEADNIVAVHAGLNAVAVELTGDEAVTDGGRPPALPTSLDVATADALTIIENDRRRRFLELLSEIAVADRPIDERTYIPVSEIVNAMVAGLGQTDDRRHYDRAYIVLIQTHLPLLDDLGVINYVERSKKLQAGDDVFALAMLVDAVDAISEGE